MARVTSAVSAFKISPIRQRDRQREHWRHGADGDGKESTVTSSQCKAEWAVGLRICDRRCVTVGVP
ncbi:hypothetical protein E2C01_081986 [Portunus trituberculatus]|uniref:Uncharacterized protein n=1 Tax=Portunus trituberculatus TaxID=210409 RepID=A0A5B7J3S7_PORTR|nr:hypothetical protein [Portunus trituberculatus]